MGKRKYKGRGRVDNNGRVVLQKELLTELGIPEGTKFIQTIRDGGIFLEVAPDICRICYSEDEEMFKHFRIFTRCAHAIIAAADPD